MGFQNLVYFQPKFLGSIDNGGHANCINAAVLWTTTYLGYALDAPRRT